MCHDTHCPTITLITDSRSAIQALTQYNSANPLVKNIQHKLATFEKPIHLCWAPSHVGIRGNEEADNAAQNVILNFDVWEMQIPRSDYKCYVKNVAKHRWKQKWQGTANNKLREIRDSIEPLINSSCANREWERALTRLRIGHCRLAHGYLMVGGYPTECNVCQVQASVKHILIECHKHDVQRRTVFGNDNVTLRYVLLEADTSLNGKIYNFIKLIDILPQI